jgi:hypothetical protein
LNFLSSSVGKPLKQSDSLPTRSFQKKLLNIGWLAQQNGSGISFALFNHTTKWYFSPVRQFASKGYIGLALVKNRAYWKKGSISRLPRLHLLKLMLKEEKEMTKTLFTVLVVVALGMGFSDIAHAKDAYQPLFNTKYGTAGSVLNTCTVCHTAVPTRNAYGTAYGNNAHDFTAIEPLDSDGDGFSNLAEITARTFPGNATSKPSTSDTVKPTVTGFVIPATSSSLTVPITTLTASDNVGVTSYMVTTTATAPGALSTKWTAAAPTSFTFPLATPSGTKTLYAWVKDAAKNVSLTLSAQVVLSLPGPDRTKPTVTAFTIPATSSSLTVPINTFTASDNVGVTVHKVDGSSANEFHIPARHTVRNQDPLCMGERCRQERLPENECSGGTHIGGSSPRCSRGNPE